MLRRKRKGDLSATDALPSGDSAASADLPLRGALRDVLVSNAHNLRDLDLKFSPLPNHQPAAVFLDEHE